MKLMNDSPDVLDKPKRKLFGMPMESFIYLSIISGSIGFLVAYIAKNQYLLFGTSC